MAGYWGVRTTHYHFHIAFNSISWYFISDPIFSLLTTSMELMTMLIMNKCNKVFICPRR